MGTIEISLDGGVFSAEAVVRAVHRYSADYYVDIASAEEGFIARLTPKSANIDTSALAQQVRNDALDEQLRECIRAETNGLQDTLVQAALLKVGIQSSGQTP